MATRVVFCDHVGSKVVLCGVATAIAAVVPYPRSKVRLGDVTLLLELALCSRCTDTALLGSKVVVGPHGVSDAPRMEVYAATLRESQLAQSGCKPKPKPKPAEPQNVRTVRKIGGFSVVLYAEPRLQQRAIAEWAKRYADGEVTAATFRKVLAAIEAGPVPAPGRRPNLAAADIPRDPPIPADAPMKRDTKVKLAWSPRLINEPGKGFYDANNPPPALKVKRGKSGTPKTSGTPSGTPKGNRGGTP